MGTAKWTASMIGVLNAKAVDKMPIRRTDANIAASVLSVIVTANVAGTAMGTVSGTGSTVNASGTLNVIETDAIVSGTEIGNETANETANEVTGIDGTKRIAIVKAGRTVTLVVELFSPPLRTVASPLERVIVPQPPLRTSWGSEEDLPMMTPTVPPNAALVKRVAKIAAGGLPTKRRTMNAQESQIGDGEIVRKMQVMVARHPTSLRRSECLMDLHRHRLPFPRRRPLPLGQWRAVNRYAMESQMLGYVSVNASGSGSGYHARVHSNIIIVNVSPWL